MAKCPHCYRSIPEAVLRCPYCHGTISAAAPATVGQPAGRRSRGGSGSVGLLVGVAVVGFLALGAVGAGIMLVPRLQQQSSPALATRAPAPTAGGPTSTAMPPTETPTPSPTRRPPDGWAQIGAATERYVAWVPATWSVYEADLDQPDAWLAAVGEISPAVQQLTSQEVFGELLRSPGTRAVAVNLPSEAGRYVTLDAAVIMQADGMIGQDPKDALASLVERVNNTYGSRGLKILLQKQLDFRGVPAAKVEYTWNIQADLGATVAVHSSRMLVFSADMVYELLMETTEDRYANVYSQVFQQFVGSFHFSTPAEASEIAMPPGWHAVRSDANGYGLWVPDDWLTFNRDTDDYAAWSTQIASSYPLGSQYLELYNSIGIDRASFVAVEPPANRNSSIWLTTAMIEQRPAEANDSSRRILERVRYADKVSGSQTKQSAVIWQHGLPTAYHETVGWINLPNYDQVTLHVYTVGFVDGDREVVLTILCLESQPKQLKATLEIMARSLRSTR